MNYNALESMLTETDYKKLEIDFLINGFRNGFDIGYRGNTQIKRKSPNLKFRVSNRTILWNKIMKEVNLKRFTGPYGDIPFKFYIQSPVGLVPKDNGKETRLIFHFSYPRNGSSIDSETPKELTTVQYCDFADTILECIRAGKNCYLSKSDWKSTFRNLGIKKEQWNLLVIMAVSLIHNKTYYFINKCLPFGAAISCLHFQRFLDAIAHVM